MQAVRGMNDFWIDDFAVFSHIVNTARMSALRHGFREISTPILEFESLFVHSSGETSDIVTKEMFYIKDRDKDSDRNIDRDKGRDIGNDIGNDRDINKNRDGDKDSDRVKSGDTAHDKDRNASGDLTAEANRIVLRPEGTAAVMRAILTNGLTQDMPQKVFYVGPMFRYNRPQKGRLRQFHQASIEFIGIDSWKADLEVIACAWNFLSALQLNDKVSLNINTLGDARDRYAYRQKLSEFLEKYKHDLSPDSQQRLTTNPLRILDSKAAQDITIVQGAPRVTECLSKESRVFFDNIINNLSFLGIAYHVNELLVRGLDYYTHTVFEFVPTDNKQASQGTVLAGGRYDGLMETLGGPKITGVGWSAGVERLILLAMMQHGNNAKHIDIAKVAVICVTDAEFQIALRVAENIRNKYIADIIIEKDIGKCLKKASKSGALVAVIIGEDEIASQTLTIKDLQTGLQQRITDSDIMSSLKQFSLAEL